VAIARGSHAIGRKEYNPIVENRDLLPPYMSRLAMLLVSFLLICSMAGCLDGFVDSDGDGLKDDSDNCPDIANQDQINYDADSLGDECDLDDDNDGIEDSLDLCDYGERDWVSANSTDFDSDGCQDSGEDNDDDNDGFSDTEDVFPLDASEAIDTDGDGVGDNSDVFPLDANETIDTDGDGVGDNSDAFPLDDRESYDFDEDGIGDNADTDDDNDGVSDYEDSFPLDFLEWSDFDEDGIGDNADTDDDNDGVLDDNDWFVLGNGGIMIHFTKFQIWSNGNYDSSSAGTYPDVYAYLGISNCEGSMTYNDDYGWYTDVTYMEDWWTHSWNIYDNLEEICISITIYDEDPMAPDQILDFVPGNRNGIDHIFDLTSGILSDGGEEIFFQSFDNRGENSLSILVEYEISRFAIED